MRRFTFTHSFEGERGDEFRFPTDTRRLSNVREEARYRVGWETFSLVSFETSV